MIQLIKKYTTWLHTQWPAGIVEKLPYISAEGTSNIIGLYIVGDLTGIPLLKFSSDSGARAVQRIVRDSEFQKQRKEDRDPKVIDIVIVGAGISGMAAGLEAKKAGLTYEILEATEPFSTIENFPARKPIYTYPTDMIPAGDLQFTAKVKEPLIDELHDQTFKKGIEPRMAHVEKVIQKKGHFELVITGEEKILAKRVIVGIGRSGNFRKLDVHGEDLDKVYNRLHDPKDFCNKNVLVVGGGDSALETAIAVGQCGANVTLSYRRNEFSRPKPENIDSLYKLKKDPMANVAIETPTSERVTTSSGGFLGEHRKPGKIKVLMGSQVVKIEESIVELTNNDGEKITLPNDAVFTMIGREAPLEFFRRSGVRITGEMNLKGWIALGLFMLFCAWLYNWKAGGELTKWFKELNWFPYNIPGLFDGWSQFISNSISDPSSFLWLLAKNIGDPGFYYSVVYCLLILIFGIRRIKRRKTPYVKIQTWTLTAIQVIPLFLLPYIILPMLGQAGIFDSGFGKSFADALFPESEWSKFGREYWRSIGFILAWPLFIWNVFTWQPMGWWLVISLLQTFVLIPVIIYFWGKGAYCGWICSCGALAETLGDSHRHKMLHGAVWNRVNMVGQIILFVVFLLLFARIISWILPDSGFGKMMNGFYVGLLYGWQIFGVQVNYKWIVDLFLAGIVGYGAYFWFSGRVWCRFACPLAALMHIYARFSRFRILSDKKKCISCNVCTSVCHQGIDVMNFANKGLPMEDPECVRCSACVESCPTGVLQFGQIDRKTGDLISYDKLAASPVLIRESEILTSVRNDGD